MSKNEKTCWGCGETFTYDSNDLRPYIYHQCRDGVYAAHQNPNLNKSRQQTTYNSETTTKPKHHTIWQNFNGL